MGGVCLTISKVSNVISSSLWHNRVDSSFRSCLLTVEAA